MLELALILVFAAHVAAVGIASLSPLAVFAFEMQAQRGDEAAGRVARRVALHAAGALFVGMALGAFALWLIWSAGAGWDSPYFQAWARVPARRIYFGAAHIAVFTLCLVWYASRRRQGRGGWFSRVLPVFAASDLLYHFPPLFIAVAQLAAQPAGGGELGYRELVQMQWTPENLVRVVHFMLAGATAAGVYLLVLAAEAKRRGEVEESSLLARWGARSGLAATALQLLSGVTVFLMLRVDAQQQLMGGDAWSAAGLTLGVLTSFALMHVLAAAAGQTLRLRDAYTAGLLIAVILASMSAVRHRLRPVAMANEHVSTVAGRTHVRPVAETHRPRDQVARHDPR